MTSGPANHFVLHRDFWGHGHTTFCIVSTERHMAELLANVSAALAAARDGMQPAPATPGEPRTLWTGPLTLAGKPAGRIELSFQIAPDLAPYHRVRRQFWAGLCFASVAILLLYFATIGVKETFGG